MGDGGEGGVWEGLRTEISRGFLRSWLAAAQWGRAEAVKCGERRSIKYLTVCEQEPWDRIFPSHGTKTEVQRVPRWRGAEWRGRVFISSVK